MTAGDRTEVAALVIERVAEVLALDARDVRESARFEEDLAADSLDRIEVIEAVEADLRARGVRVTLPDDEVEGMRTVGDAVDRVCARLADRGAAP